MAGLRVFSMLKEPTSRGEGTTPRFLQPRGYSARLHRTGATSAPALRTAPPQQGRLGTCPASGLPHLGPLSWLCPAQAPAPALALQSPRSSRLPGNQRAADQLRGSWRGRSGNTPDATAVRLARRPRGSGPSWAEKDARSRRPAWRPH